MPYSTRIVEYGNARFIENGQSSGSSEPRKVDVQETKVETFTPSVSPPVVVPLIVPQFRNVLEQQNNILTPLDEHVNDEPTNNKQATNEQVLPKKKIALRRFTKQKRLAFLNDHMVYSLEHEYDLSVDKDPISFKQAMECNNFEKWFNVMKEELELMDDNKV